jgi:hypothetical protein
MERQPSKPVLVCGVSANKVKRFGLIRSKGGNLILMTYFASFSRKSKIYHVRPFDKDISTMPSGPSTPGILSPEAKTASQTDSK